MTETRVLWLAGAVVVVGVLPWLDWFVAAGDFHEAPPWAFLFGFVAASFYAGLAAWKLGWKWSWLLVVVALLGAPAVAEMAEVRVPDGLFDRPDGFTDALGTSLMIAAPVGLATVIGSLLHDPDDGKPIGDPEPFKPWPNDSTR